MTYEVLDPTVVQIVLIGLSACISVLGLMVTAAYYKIGRLTKRVEGMAADIARLRNHKHRRNTGEVLERRPVRVSDARYTPRRMETGAESEE